MSVHRMQLAELESEIKKGKQFFLVEPVFDSKQNLLIGTEKVLGEKDLSRFRERCPEQLHKALSVRVAIPHFIEEDKRIKWAAYVISLFEGTELFKNLQRQKKDFVVKYLKTNLMENDYVIWKLSQLKNLSKKYFEHAICTCCIALSVYETYSSLNQQGMIDSLYIDSIIAASLIHPIGLLNFDQASLEKKRLELTPNNTAKFYEHTINGFKLIKSEEGKHELSDEVLQAIMNHEEYVDGSGAPRGIGANDMSFLDKLISLSNYFDLILKDEFALRPRPYREYIAKMRAEKSKFDPMLFEALDLTFKYLFGA